MLLTVPLTCKCVCAAIIPSIPTAPLAKSAASPVITPVFES